MKVRFIINPKSGGGRKAERYQRVVEDLIGGGKIEGDIVCTTAPSHATNLAREAEALGFTHVVCVGGDGTLNEIAQALVHSDVILAILPTGSGNGLARHLGIPLSLEANLAMFRAQNSAVALIDTGTINGRRFCNVAGLGFDAEVAAAFNAMTRRGFWGYVRVILRLFRSRQSVRYRITSSAGQIWSDALILAIANTDQYGNNAKIAPRASAQDGRLDVVAIADQPWWRIPALVFRLFAGTIDRSPFVTRLSADRLTITRRMAAVLHTDGEVHLESVVVEVAVSPRSLRVLVPPQGVESIHAATAVVGTGDVRVGVGDGGRDWQFLYLVGCAGMAVFVFAVYGAFFSDPLGGLDQTIIDYAKANRTPFGTSIMEVVSALGSLPFVSFLVVSLGVLFAGTRRIGELIALILAVPGGMLINLFLKWAFHRPRPSGAELAQPYTEFSFPSGHTGAATLLYGFLAILAVARIERAWLRILAVVVAHALIFGVAFSRVYLGVHYASDVIAAIGLYLFWLVISVRSAPSLSQAFHDEK